MLTSFILHKAPSIVFGIGKRAALPDLLEKFGKNILLVRGKQSLTNSKVFNEIIALLAQKAFEVNTVHIEKEPSAEDIDTVVNEYRNKPIDVVLAIGGGSVMDAGKAISAMLLVEGAIENYLEGVGDRVHPGTKVPFIAMPTTSGTGSEASKNAVISKIGEGGYKKSLRHDNFTPDYAIVDPDLTVSCPRDLTMRSGLDAFTQLLESYLSINSNPLMDALALEGLKNVTEYLTLSVEQPTNSSARAGMAYAAMLSGFTLANVGLGTIHGFASSIGGRFDIPHGTICGTLIGVVNRLCLKRAEEDGLIQVIDKYAEIGKLYSKRAKRSSSYYAWYFIEVLDNLVEDFKIPKLGEFGVRMNDVDSLIKQTSNKNNPVTFTEVDLDYILMERL